MEKLKLRPHHGLCIRYFQGQGYSEEFLENMKKCIWDLEMNPIIELVREQDCICKACPNLENGICSSQDHVDQFDTKVLSSIGKAAGEEINYLDFQKMLQKEIFDANQFHRICGDCEWGTICHNE